ncbi:hypothetical protein ACIBTV_14065 [Micromonospora sp. NPDC049366]|uniref:hypothetical protein n=1 Tax=Micromonospora sp. NPDC049366 TaxID=3364271 RepID=UPI0037B23474
MSEGSDEPSRPARDDPERAKHRAAEQLVARYGDVLGGEDALADEDARVPDTAVTEKGAEEPP